MPVVIEIMKIIMKVTHALRAMVLVAITGLAGRAQENFTAADLPSQVGGYYRAYVNSSDASVSQLLGAKGGPRRWDFSQARGAQDEIQRTDIVAATDGGHAADFPGAAYAERITRESGGGKSWSYYKIVPGQGRAYYGFYDPVGNAIDPSTAFDAPTLDLPATAAYGQTWKRTVDFQDILDLGFMQDNVQIHFTSEAKVDAYGTLVLPSLGEVAALRVNEVNSYQTTDTTLGMPLGTQYFRNYYWLVKGIGKAVQIISEGGTSVPEENFATAKSVLRVFESNGLAKPETNVSVSHLTLVIKGTDAFLKWDRKDASASYRIQYMDRLGALDVWKNLSDTTDNFCFDPLNGAGGVRFYRVTAAQ